VLARYIADQGHDVSVDDTQNTPSVNGHRNGHVGSGDGASGVVDGDNGGVEETAPAPLDPRAAAAVGAPAIQVAPGEVTHTTLSVTNLRSEACTFALTLSGLEPGWYGLPSRVGPLQPGERAEVPFHVSLPRGYPPCSLLLSVEARPLLSESAAAPVRKALPGRPSPTPVRALNGNGTRGEDERRVPGRHDVSVLVGDGATVAARLDPVDVEGIGRGRFALVLRNRGSQSQQVHLFGVSPDPGLVVDFEKDDPLLLPGRQVEVPGSLRVHRRFKGEPQRHPFAVRVQGRGTPVMAEGSFTSSPLLPPWAFKAIAILVVVAMWATIAVFGIKILSAHLHRAAVQRNSVTQPTTAAHGKKATGKSKTSTKTGKGTSTSKTTSNGSGGSNSSGGTAPGNKTAKTSKKPSSKPPAPKQTVEVAGKVAGPSPGGVTVTLSATSLVSPTVLGASGGSGAGTVASSVHRLHGHHAHRSEGPAGVTYGPGALLTAAVRHKTAAHGPPTDPSTPMLVNASGHISRIPDGKVYGTEAAAAFFPSLVAAITPALTTKTLADGSFVFTRIPAPGTYLVSFTQPGYNTRKYVVQTKVGTNITLNTLLSPGTGSLSGTVSGPNGPLGGVSITVSDGSVTVTTVTPTTGAGIGTWSVSGLNTPDSYLVSASASGFGTQITTASLAPSASLAGVDLTMKPGVGSISGTVTAGAQPVGGVTVTATDGTLSATATTSTVSPVGTYTLPNLAIPGTWTVAVSGAGWITQTQLVKLSGNATVNASLTSSGANVVGVVSSKGSGLANVGLTLSNQSATFKTLSESVSPVGGFDFGQIPPGQYVLSATSFGYTTQSASVKVTAGQTVTVTLTMPYVGTSGVKTGTITGSVVDEFTGAPIGTLPMELDGKPTGKVTNSNGVYSITKVSPGLHEVTAIGSAKGFADASVQVSVAEGATVTAPVILLPNLASMNGIVLSGATGLPVPTPKVQLLLGGIPVGTPVKYSSTKTGTYSITNITAGNYVLEVTATGFDPSETSVSLAPGEALTDNVTLTQGPSFQVKTYIQTSTGVLRPQTGVCVVVARTTAGTKKTPVAKLSTAQGGPVVFTALVAGQTYVASFKQPNSPLTNPTTCKTLTSAQVRASAATDVFVARPDNTTIFPAVLTLPHGALQIMLQFPYVRASGHTGTGVTQDCLVEATTATLNPCPHVLSSAQTATLPTVTISGTTGYAAQTTGTPGTPQTATFNLVPSGPGLWTYPASAPSFVSTQVTLIVSDTAGQFETLRKAETLPGSGTTQKDIILTPKPVPISGTIFPTSGVSIAVNPNVLSPSSTPGVANNLTSTDTIGAVEGTSGALKWSDPATGVSGGSAQPGSYGLTLTDKGYVSVTKTVKVPLCPPKAACGITVTGLSLEQQITLVVSPHPTGIPGTSIALPKVTLYLGAGTTDQIGQKQLVKTGGNFTATFTDQITPTQTTPTHHFRFTVTGPGIQTFTSGALNLATARRGTLTATPTLVDDGWLTGTVDGVLVPTNAGSPGATEPLSGATVIATIDACSTTTHVATFSATTTSGKYFLIGTTGGLIPTTTYHLCVSKTGFMSSTGTTLVASAGHNTKSFTIDAKQITQKIVVKGVAAGVVVTATASSPIGPTLSCTFTVGSTTPHVCSATVTASKTTTSATLFTFKLDPTTYSFNLSAPQYGSLTVGPIPYTPGEVPQTKTYTLTQQVVTISGKVTVSATGRGHNLKPILTLPITLVSSSGTKYTTTTQKTGSHTGTYSFPPVPTGSYTITVGDTYTTISPISFSTGTTRTFVENFIVYAPSIPVKVKVTNPVTGASANGVTVTLTPATNQSAVTDKCGTTHELLEEGLGNTQTATAVGTSSLATASFSSVVPDVYTVTFSGIGTKTDSPKPASHQLVVCPSPATSPATTPTTPTFKLGVGEITATVTLATATAKTKVTMSAGTLKASCTSSTPVSTTASCTVSLLVVLTTTYSVTVSATGYVSTSQHVEVTSGTPTKSLTVTLHPPPVSGVTVTLSATTAHALVTASMATASVTLSGSHTYAATTNASDVATFSTAIVPGHYKVLVTPHLTGASQQTDGTFKVKGTAKSFSAKVKKAGKVTGTITLTKKTTAHAVTVKVSIGATTCTTATIAKGATPPTATYTCFLPPGTYTLTFTPSGTVYTKTSISSVAVAATGTTTKNVTLT
jgi:hypothetical protein